MKNEIKNKILTISGEPASGKSTVIKELIKNYEEQGYNLHLMSVGNMFREIAKEKGLSIEELNEYMKKRANIDELIDRKVKECGKKINSKERPNDIYIFDSRLAWYNIPNSFSIRLIVNDDTAGKRVFNDTSRGKEDHYNTLEDAIKSTSQRKKDEVERYKERYNIDLTDPNNYKLIVDTSCLTVEKIANIIMECEKSYTNNLPFKKNWENSLHETPEGHDEL